MRAPSDLPRPPRRVRVPSGRGRVVLVVVAVALFVLVTSLRGIAGFYTDYLWFDSLDQTGVWGGVLGAKIALGVIFTATFFALLWTNLFIADRLAPPFRPAGPEEDLVERYHELVGRRTGLVRAVTAALFALIAGAGVSSQWNDWILFTNRVDFGVRDELFHRDIGFYVFQLPFLTFVVGWLFAAFVIVLVVTAIAHYLNGGIRVQTPLERVTPQVKAHLSVLLALLALIKAAGYFLQQYELTGSTRGTVNGATYTDVNVQLPAIRLLLLISLFAFALFIVNIFRRGWVLPVLAVGLWAFVAVVAGGIVPALVQRFRVEPSESSREALYIERNVNATKNALGLDAVTSNDFAADGDLADAELANNADVVRNIRLWDPRANILGRTYQALQAQRSFYRISDVDVDRYELDGQTTQVNISVRELDTDGVQQDSWEARHLAFTHGYGVVMSPANAQDTDGRPDLIVSDVPVNVEESTGIEIDQPGIYFGQDLSGYVIIDTRRQEIDFQDNEGETQFTAYEGEDGIDIGSFARRAAFALRFGDFNPLFSGNLRESSRILIRRDVEERVRALAPFLDFDADPYPVVIGGEIKWVIDAYTTTSRYPYAQRAVRDGLPEGSGLDHGFNYVRNSVKAVLDAYDGSVTFYIIDPEDPIAEAYRRAFPDLFTTESPPDALREHFRYPEDLFRVQTNMWGRYHINDADDFYNSNDGWVVARDPGTTRVVAPTPTSTAQDPNEPAPRQDRIDPYYLLTRLPGEVEESFVMLRPFVPISDDDDRQLLTAFMVARSDPDDYGQLETFVMPRDNLPDGPGIVAGTISGDVAVSELETLLGQEGSDLQFGNLLFIPIEQSLLYVQPVYVVADQNPVPLLRQVIVEFQGQVSVAPTLREALAGLPQFDNVPETLEEPDQGATPPGDDGADAPSDEAPSDEDATVSQLLTDAQRLFVEADAALSQSPPNFAEYDTKTREARALLDQAADLIEDAADEGASPGGDDASGTTTSTTVPPSTSVPPPEATTTTAGTPA